MAGAAHKGNQNMLHQSDNAFRRRARTGGLALIVSLYLMTVTGCLVGPDFKPPQTQVPASWIETATAQPPSAAQFQELVHWWTTFSDPMLSSLVDRAIQSNLDLKLAQARIRQARAARNVTAAGLGPTVDAAGSYVRSASGVQTASGSKNLTSSLYRTGLDAAWELDIFGGVRRSVEAADANVQAAVEDRRDVLVTLAAEVALNYTDLRSFQQQIAIAQENLEAQRHTAEITRQRFQAGFVGALDVANANAQVASTASQIPLLEAFARQAIYSLSILLGREPSALLEELTPAAAIPAAPPATPVGVPADLLRRRPDIRRAEAQIHAATAQIGVATADLFPKFALSGSVGFQSDQFSSWMDWVNRFWLFGPSANWQIFASGGILANIELQKALQEQSLITYQQTVLTALQDVENALVASTKEAQRREALTEAVNSNRKAVQYSLQLYTQGQVDFLNVLDAQRSLYVSELTLVQSTHDISTDLVALYKALGGGWKEEPQLKKDPVTLPQLSFQDQDKQGFHSMSTSGVKENP
jgi:multidrug efflux system outer membrane protein